MPGFGVRAFTVHDAAEVAALHARVYPQAAWASQAETAAYFREILFRNPWHDSELPSWVAIDEGRIVGFLGVLPRRMLAGARTLRVAVGCQFMVDPDKRSSFAAIRLLRHYFSGPQDLSIADGANEAARACWQAAGGATSPLHNLHWVRLLRPAQGALHLAAGSGRLRGLATLAMPVAALADACSVRLCGGLGKPRLQEEALAPNTLAEAFAEHRGAFALRPDYDADALRWLLGQAGMKSRYGPLESVVLRDPNGRAAGWFLYYRNPRMSQVLQVGGRRERLAQVLDQMFAHARERGAVAIQGRLEPHMASALQGRRCLLQSRSIHTLLHARDANLLVPFYSGDAFFTRLEGEWWTRFSDQAPAAGEDKGSSIPVRKEKLPAIGAVVR
jgi:hypothetical protein